MHFEKILIAVDYGPIAAHAVDVGVDLAHSLHAQLAFVHAVDPTDPLAPESGIPAAQLLAEAEREGQKLLERFREELGEPTSPVFFAVGKPAHEIVEAARMWHADVVVVGSHGRGGLRRVVLGSVAEEVMRQAPCPVLAVRATT